MTTALAAPPQSGLMTADEFYDWCNLPENSEKRFELVRGKVIEVPPPTKIHGVVSGNLAFELGTYIRKKRKGYITTNDSGTLLERNPDTVRGPDVAYFTDADTFADLHPKYGENPPILAVEIFSPNDKLFEVLQKVDDYLENGVAVVWLVKPDERAIRVYRPGVQTITLSEKDTLTGGDELPDFSCLVSDLFLLPNEVPEKDAPPPS